MNKRRRTYEGRGAICLREDFCRVVLAGLLCLFTIGLGVLHDNQNKYHPVAPTSGADQKREVKQ